jgi:hypothetical protein
MTEIRIVSYTAPIQSSATNRTLYLYRVIRDGRVIDEDSGFLNAADAFGVATQKYPGARPSQD